MTETDTKYVRAIGYKTTAMMFVIMSLMACLGFFIAWQTFVFFEAIVVISCVITVIPNKRIHHHYVLRFEGDRLYITDETAGKTYQVYDIPADDIVIRQSKNDQKIDYCDVLIKNTVFAFGGVKKCSELKEYIAANYDS